jgi:hypothetical protein
MSSHILWLKYQGTGRITSSPAGERGDRGGEGLVAARGDGDLRLGDLAAVGADHVRGQFRAQLGQAEDGAVEMRAGIVQHRLGHGPAQRLGRGLDRGGLADVQQRAVGRKATPVAAAIGLDVLQRHVPGEEDPGVLAHLGDEGVDHAARPLGLA